MRIKFPSKTNDSGKYKFLGRLKKALGEKPGVIISDKKPDISLAIVPQQFVKGTKNVLRIDGIWFNTIDSSWKGRNLKKSNAMKKFDGIVYQNEFCKKAGDIYLGKTKKPVACIFNGADPLEFNYEKLETEKPFFMSLCRWRPHKRLKDTVKGFLRSGLCEEYDLWIFGEADYKKKHKSIKYCKWGDKNTLGRALYSCIATTHLAWIDWCPNSVIESIVAGKPVIHTLGGGTGLIVQSDGPVIKDVEWNFKPTNLYDPPPLNLEEVGEAYKKSIEYKSPNRIDLHINTIADQYLKFFKRVISG